MAVVQKTSLILVVPPPVNPREDMGQKWIQGLTNSATLMNERRLSKIPDAEAFGKQLAIPAAESYSPYVPSDYVSKRGRSQKAIQNAHRKNLTNAYTKWNDKLALAFETVDGVEAKRFKDQVANTVDSWLAKVEQKTLRFTGDKIRGRGLSVIAGYWLTGEKEKVSGMLRGGDQAEGEAYDISYDSQRPTLRAALTQLLTQTGITILNGELDSAIVDEQNGRLKTALSAFSDRTKSNEFDYPSDPAKSYCAFEFSEDKGLYLRIRIMLGS